MPFFKTPGVPFRTQIYDLLVPFSFPARREITDYLSVRARLLLRSPVINPKALSRRTLWISRKAEYIALTLSPTPRHHHQVPCLQSEFQ